MPYINTKYLFQCNTCRNHNKSGCAVYCDHGEAYIPDMSKIPEAEVEEVVRCKECRYFEFKGSSVTQGLCKCGEMDMNYGGEFYPLANDFCSYGTPKERGEKE